MQRCKKAGVRDLPSTKQLDALRGHLVGTVELADIVAIDGAPQQVRSEPFCEGPYCRLLSDPRRLTKPVPCRGAQQPWNVPDELVAKLKSRSSASCWIPFVRPGTRRCGLA